MVERDGVDRELARIDRELERLLLERLSLVRGGTGENWGEDGYLRCRQAVEGRRVPLLSPKVLYQGEPGAYADEAAARFFGEASSRDSVSTWEEIFIALQEGRADYGVLPIENSSTGSINQVYDLLAQYGAYIVGEQMLKVEHCLAAPPGATLESVTAVYSHEQGLQQCAPYLNEHSWWGQFPRLNTAESAKFVAESRDPAKAAICSRRAAGLYGLEVLAQSINFNKDNYTRFVVVSPQMELRPGSDKISALFVLQHRSGTLYEIMTIFAKSGLNMMKLESRPMAGHSWEYRFFVDFTGDISRPEMDSVLRELARAAEDFRVLGNYQGGQGRVQN